MTERNDLSDSVDISHIHHVALQTSNITRAMEFYSLFGFSCVERFRAGPARAAWLEHESSQSRLELMEVPSHQLLNTSRAPDVLCPGFLGYHHVALNVDIPLEEFLDNLNEISHKRFGKRMRLALWPPKQQRIGMAGLFDVAFLHDADGCLVELIYKVSNVSSKIESGWEPWDGTGFVTSRAG